MSQPKVKSTQIRRAAIAILLLSILSLLAGASVQRPGFYIEYGAVKAGTFETPIIYVKATKTKDHYDQIDLREDGKLGYSVKVSGRCPESWRLGSGSLGVRGANKSQPVDYPVNSDHRSIGQDHGNEWDVFAFRIPFFYPQDGSPIDLCNAALSRSNEADRKRILQDGLNLDFDKAYRASLSIFCDDNKKVGFGDPPRQFTAETNLPLKIRCLPVAITRGAPPRPGKPLDIDPPIQSVEVIPDPVATQGRKCPVYVNFRGKITAGEKSQYTTFNTKYRFLGDHDYASDWLPVSITRGQPRTVNGRRFIQSSDTPRGFKTPGAKQNVPIFHGWMLLEVMLPDGTTRSEKALFTVDCNEKPAR